MSQQQLIQDQAQAETQQLPWIEKVNPLELKIIKLLGDYQEDKRWLEYEPDGKYHGVYHGALFFWMEAYGMSREEFEHSIKRMAEDPDIPIRETSGSTPDHRRYEHFW